MNRVRARRNHKSHRVARALSVGVHLLQALAQRMHRDPNNRVMLRIEVRTPAQGLYRDRVLLQAVRPSCCALFADIAQNTSRVRRPAQHTRLEEPIKLGALRRAHLLHWRSEIHCDQTISDFDLSLLGTGTISPARAVVLPKEESHR